MSFSEVRRSSTIGNVSACLIGGKSRKMRKKWGKTFVRANIFFSTLILVNFPGYARPVEGRLIQSYKNTDQNGVLVSETWGRLQKSNGKGIFPAYYLEDRTSVGHRTTFPSMPHKNRSGRELRLGAMLFGSCSFHASSTGGAPEPGGGKQSRDRKGCRLPLCRNRLTGSPEPGASGRTNRLP